MSQNNSNHDGIVELDNPPPLWWNVSFGILIVFGAAYFAYYHVFEGHSIAHDYAHQIQDLENRQAIRLASEKVDVPRLIALGKDPAALGRGKGTFSAKCAACHGASGEGLIGPNLTDDHWLHGDGTSPAVYQVIKTGVSEKGMPPWGGMLKPAELMEVAAFVRSLRGSHPAGGKAPQGAEHHEHD